MSQPWACPFFILTVCLLLQKGVERAPEGALRNLPELSQLENKNAMWESIQLKYFGLTEALETLAYDNDNSSLSEDISLAYRRLNELHRIVEELHHANGDVVDTIDQEITDHITLHNGMIDMVSSIKPRVLDYWTFDFKRN